MKDLTKGPVGGLILHLATLIALTTVFQTLYFLADLYFVGRLGKEAIAGVSLSGNLMMIVLALTQSLGVGATALVSQALGQKNRRHAEFVFNQALVLSTLAGVAFGVVMFSLRRAYGDWLAADALTASSASQYLDWFVPALALQFPLVAMGAALRGAGDLKMPTVIQIATVLLNIGLAPMLIFGLGTGRPLGVAGAALASLVAIGAGCIAMTLYFQRASSPIRIRTADWAPQPSLWARILRIGLPAGGEFALIAVYIVLVYDIIQPFGAAAQAGFGIGVRIMQSLFLPAVAIGFATAPIAGQNFGARLGDRVRQTFYVGAAMSAGIMVVVSLLCHIAPDAMVRVFNSDTGVVAFGAEYLRIISWNFALTGVIFVSSSIFQGMGHTLPALSSSMLRLVLFAVPAYMVAQQPGFQMRHVWYLSVASVAIQLGLNLWLLHREFDRKLSFEPIGAEMRGSV